MRDITHNRVFYSLWSLPLLEVVFGFWHIYITLYMTSVFLCCSGTCVKTIYKPPSPGLVFFIIQAQGPLVHRIFFYFLPKVISNVSEANGEKNKECGGVWLFVSNGIFLPLILTEQSSRVVFFFLSTACFFSKGSQCEKPQSETWTEPWYRKAWPEKSYIYRKKTN